MRYSENIKVDISQDDVLRMLGRKRMRASGRTAKRLERFIDRARRLVKPRVLYTTRKIADVHRGEITLRDGPSFKSAKLSSSLGKCDSATVFLATIGDGIDAIVRDLSSKNKLSDAYIYDAIGSAAVEGVVEGFQNTVDQALSESEKATTLRFSPGYCDWNIEEQGKIFEVLEGEAVGVSLSPNFLMNPRKSVSGVFGITPGPQEARPNPCTMCSRKSCIARR